MPDRPIASTEPSAVLNRRQFLTTAGATAVGVTVLSPNLVGGAEANSKINIGLIGCGGRGTWIMDFFKKHGGFNVVACADYFKDKAEAAGAKHGIPESLR